MIFTHSFLFFNSLRGLMLMYMKSAFLFRIVFPPPATCTKIFTRLDRSCAWRTSNAYKSPVVQNVVGNIIFIDIILYLLCCPVQQRMIFNDLVAFVPFHLLHIVAV